MKTWPARFAPSKSSKYFRALVPYLGAISDQDADTMIRTIETFYQVMCERREHLDD